MNDGEELNARRTRLMEIRFKYGKTSNAFVPEEQPFPDEWDPVVPGQGENGQLRPQTFKHCQGTETGHGEGSEREVKSLLDSWQYRQYILRPRRIQLPDA